MSIPDRDSGSPAADGTSTRGTRPGPGRPRRIPVDEERALVLAAARRVFGRSGLAGAGIGRIAREAGVSRQAVYALYGDKAALFRATVADVEEDLYAAVSGDVLAPTEEDLLTVARRDYARLFDFVRDHPDAYPVLREAERTGDPALARVHARLVPLYAEGSRRRFAASGIESGRADEVLVSLYFAMTEALATGQEHDADRAALLDLLAEFTVGGVSRVLRHRPDIIMRLRRP